MLRWHRLGQELSVKQLDISLKYRGPFAVFRFAENDSLSSDTYLPNLHMATYLGR